MEIKLLTMPDDFICLSSIQKMIKPSHFWLCIRSSLISEQFVVFPLISLAVCRWLLDEGSVFQPLDSNDALEEEAERQLLSTSGAAHRALLEASADIYTTANGRGGGITAELAQLHSVLGMLFGTQVLNSLCNCIEWQFTGLFWHDRCRVREEFHKNQKKL
jgi:hypothetical protein